MNMARMYALCGATILAHSSCVPSEIHSFSTISSSPRIRPPCMPSLTRRHLTWSPLPRLYSARFSQPQAMLTIRSEAISSAAALPCNSCSAMPSKSIRAFRPSPASTLRSSLPLVPPLPCSSYHGPVHPMKSRLHHPHPHSAHVFAVAHTIPPGARRAFLCHRPVRLAHGRWVCLHCRTIGCMGWSSRILSLGKGRDARHDGRQCTF